MKKTIAVILGGQSSEHEVSCVSGATIARNINPEKYELILIGITKQGEWLKIDAVDDIPSGRWLHGATQAIISPAATEKCVLFLNGGSVVKQKIDVAFPALHGLYGEDGTIQGLLELARIPYVGCGVLSSSVAMDKTYTKLIVEKLGVRQAAYVALRRRELEDMDAAVRKVETKLAYPVFIKPSNAGSSRGISKARDRAALAAGLEEAARHDYKLLVEEAIDGRELECAVLSRAGGCEASGVGEIIAAAEFYDYDAKYNNAASKTIIEPALPAGKAEEIRRAALAVFQAVDGHGLARVDFFLTRDHTVVFNEINTLPGFTGISMYPMLWEARGLAKPQLIETLIDSALNRPR